MTKFPRVISVGTRHGNDESLVHVPQDQRAYVGERIAVYADWAIRDIARASGRPAGPTAKDKLCPGCYITVMINALLSLAERNGQDPAYLAKYAANALFDIARDGSTRADRQARDGVATTLEGGQDGKDRADAVELGKRVFSGLRGPVSRYEAFMDMSDPEALKARDDADCPPEPLKPRVVPPSFWPPSIYKRSDTGDRAYDDYVDNFWTAWTPGDGDPLTRDAFAAQVEKQEAERFGAVFPKLGTPGGRGIKPRSELTPIPFVPGTLSVEDGLTKFTPDRDTRRNTPFTNPDWPKAFTTTPEEYAEQFQQWPEGHGDNFVHPTRPVNLQGPGGYASAKEDFKAWQDKISEPGIPQGPAASCGLRERSHRYDHD